MSRVAVTKTVQAPIEIVFDVFTDVEAMVDRVDGITQVEKLTDGPIAAGTKWSETREMLKRDATAVLEFTEFEKDKRYVVVAEECGVKYDTEFRFEAVEDGTQVFCEMTSKPTTMTARILGIVVFPMTWAMKSIMRKCLDGDMEDLKRCIETGEATADVS